MKSYDIDLTDTQRTTLRTLRAAMLLRTPGAAPTATDIDRLYSTVLDLLTLSMDDPELTAADKHFSLGFDTDGTPNAPEYRHEFYVSMDTDYTAAWRYDHDPTYPAIVEENPQLMRAVTAGQTRYTYREADPDIVWRSLLRNGWRDPEEGEGEPPEVLGRRAPKVIAILPSISRTETVPALG